MSEPITNAPPRDQLPADSVDVSVVFPVLNERENLVELIQQIHQALAPTGRTYELIAVDDGSTDGSHGLLRELAASDPRLRAILFRRNAGQTAAFDAGFRNSRGRTIVTIDSDLQNDPADIPGMLKILDEGYDLVAGWRYKRRDGVFLRKIPSRIANYIVRKVTHAQVHDLGCSLRAYRREIALELGLYGEMHRFIAPLADSIGARIAEVKVNHRARTRGTSKYGLMRSGKVLLDLLTVWFLRSYQTKPIYVFGGIGLVLGALAFLVAGVVIWEKAHGVWVHRNPLFLVMILFGLLGVQSMSIGLLSEIMVRTYFESSHKTVYSIRERIGFPADPSPPTGPAPTDPVELKG